MAITAQKVWSRPVISFSHNVKMLLRVYLFVNKSFQVVNTQQNLTFNDLRETGEIGEKGDTFYDKQYFIDIRDITAVIPITIPNKAKPDLNLLLPKADKAILKIVRNFI